MPTTYVEFDDAALDEMRAINATIEDLLRSTPPISAVDPAVTRQARAEGHSAFGAVPVLERGRDETISGPGGDIPIRIFEPEDHEPRGAFLHFHGGGWVLGSASQQDPLLAHIADSAGLAVVSVDYRLAPEHPFPAGPDDCEAAACWFLDRAAEQWDGPLLIGGESAGAHLSVLTLLRLRDRHGITGVFSGANLVFGCYDLGMTPSQKRWGDRNLILSTPIIQWFVDCATPGLSTEQRRDPEISPLWADLTGMPPALFLVGTLDPLLDDSLFMAARWEAAGNEAELRVYPESIHAFNAFPSAIGADAARAQTRFIRGRAGVGAR